MSEWKQILILVVPLLMNWWEVRKLRKEVRERLDLQDVAARKLADRVSSLEELSGPVHS